jgi:hypothetical protein
MRLCKKLQLVGFFFVCFLSACTIIPKDDLNDVSIPETPRALAILITGTQAEPDGPFFSGSVGSVMLEFSSDYSYIEGRLITSRFGTSVERIDVRLGRPGSTGPLVFVIPLTLVPGVEGQFRLDETDFCPRELCDLEDLRTSGVENFAQVIGNIQGGNAYVEVHTKKHPEGEIRGSLVGLPANAANTVCFMWGCACEGYGSCNNLIAACAVVGANWRCIEYNESGGCITGACVTLGPAGQDFITP